MHCICFDHQVPKKEKNNYSDLKSLVKHFTNLNNESTFCHKQI